MWKTCTSFHGHTPHPSIAHAHHTTPGRECEDLFQYSHLPSDVSERHELMLSSDETLLSTDLQRVLTDAEGREGGGEREQGGRDDIGDVSYLTCSHSLILHKVTRLQARKYFM